MNLSSPILALLLLTLQRSFGFSWRWFALASVIVPVMVVLSPSWGSLGFTIGMEALVAAAIAGRLGLLRADTVYTSVGINGLTQPILYQALRLIPAAGGENWWVIQLIAEVIVFLVEAGLYLAVLRIPASAASIAKTLKLSAAANGLSAALGLLLPF